MGKRHPAWHVRADMERRVYLTRKRRRATITITAPDGHPDGLVPTVVLAANLDARAIRRLAARCTRLADAIDVSPDKRSGS